MLQKKPAIIYGNGSQKRCFSYIDDCIKCIEESIYQSKSSKEIINIGPDEEFISIKDLADKCANITGFNSPHIYHKSRPQEVKYATCSSNKARKLLGYETRFNLEESINLTCNYIKKRGTKEFDYKINLEINNDKTPETWKKKLI